MAESLLALRTDLISFQTTKKKHKTDPKNHPEEIAEFVTKVTHF